MKSRRVSIAAAVALVVVLCGLPAPASAGPAGNAVADWNLIAVNTLIAFPGPAGGAPPASQINMAMTQGAVYDEASPTLSPQEALLGDGLEGCGCRQRGVPSSLQHRLGRTVHDRVPEPGQLAAVA